MQTRVVSDLQGACRKGSSCIHTALTLQETISKERERNSKVFVAYYDVSKAFDSVWIDGLFFQLHNLGIKDSLWRILYKMCVDFSCCFKIGNISSSWFNMECGIHHGGFLSLMKYTVFIASLLPSGQMYVQCTYKPVHTDLVRITFGMNVSWTYGFVRTMYVHSRTYNVRT